MAMRSISAKRIHVLVLQDLLTDRAQAVPGTTGAARGVEQRLVIRSAITPLEFERGTDARGSAQAASAAAPMQQCLIPCQEASGSGRQCSNAVLIGHLVIARPVEDPVTKRSSWWAGRTYIQPLRGVASEKGSQTVEECGELSASSVGCTRSRCGPQPAPVSCAGTRQVQVQARGSPTQHSGKKRAAPW